MTIINEGMVFEPEKKAIPFTIEYNGKSVQGIAKGVEMPLNTSFDVELVGNSFTIEAEGQGDGTYKWFAHSGGTPSVEVTPSIGKEIERFFGLTE